MARHGFPMPRGGGQDLPAQEHTPRRRPPETAHEQKNLPRARRLSSAKASRHGARAKGFVSRRNTPPRRKPPDTAHERKDLPRAGTRPSAKASRHGARAKRFAPRENALLGEGLPTQRTSERICPAQEHAPRRRPPDTARRRRDLPARERSPQQKPPDTAHGRKDLPAQEHTPRRRPPETAHEQKNLPRARRLSSAKASRHGARAKEFAPRGSPSPHVPTNGGPPSAHRQPKNTPSAGSHPQRAAAAEFIHLKK